MPLNHLNQPIGETLTDYSAGQQPHIQQLIGRYTIVEPINLSILRMPTVFMVRKAPKHNGLICLLKPLEIKRIFGGILKKWHNLTIPIIWRLWIKSQAKPLEHFP